ncbi:hypothetical protein LQG66_07265 [Bradyrhizobium ontarionense]|uniref:Uncharacterized protein n=1 Tax=Bradyrhizobium ontarionense TaxID=2898149 RepID=A0ABY3RF61_9BRAD|nr:hypothetical protein [Bradyrhizobium sp. A19]UFZ06095.1 hypothetical protein LQG66_07265 [Bradyrhizobium sp. A19]
MSVIVFSARARQTLLSRIGSTTSALATIDEDAARRQALSARRLIAKSELPLASHAYESLLVLLR